MGSTRGSVHAAARLACAFAGLSAGVALAADPDVRQGNLDSDAATEEVRAEDVYPNRPPEAPHFQVRISDTCPEGDVSAAVSGVATSVGLLRLVAADRRRGKEVFFGLLGYNRANNEFGVISWREFSTAPCRRPRALFRYPPARKPARPPGARSLDDVHAALGNYSGRFRGPEVRLSEFYVDGNDASCCPTIERRTFYRYHAERDRYVRYRTVVRDSER